MGCLGQDGSEGLHQYSNHQPPGSPTDLREGRSGQGLGVGAELKGWVGEEVQTMIPYDW